jgi:disulfide oxidoreductase YuzD
VLCLEAAIRRRYPEVSLLMNMVPFGFNPHTEKKKKKDPQS